MESEFSSKVLQSLFKNSDDGFIVIDENGIVLDINEQYSSIFAKDRAEIIGHPIEETISTTSMYNVLENRLTDSHTDVYMQPYSDKDLRMPSEIRIASTRFCIFDEQGDVIGAAAQMKFHDRAEEIASKYKELELSYYKDVYNEHLFQRSGFDNLIGEDPRMQHIKRMGRRAAATSFPVLITGETGTGKEVLAKSIHLASDRKDKPFVAVNCGAIPADLLESELFGYESGAFTGAKKGGKPGKIELANGGTFFLDEIGDMPLAMQVKLLRVLQEHEIEHIGGSKPIPVDVRILSATRRNLFEMMTAGTFREDLYYRLAVVNIQTIPLRQCPGDILLHAYHHLGRLNQQYHTEVTLSETAKQCLLQHTWPGNVRELQNVLSGAYAMCDGSVITPDALPQQIARYASAAQDAGDSEQDAAPCSLREKMQRYEQAFIREALGKCGGSMTEAAKLLQIERSLLYKKMDKYGMR